MSFPGSPPEWYLLVTITVKKFDAETVTGVGLSFADPTDTIRILLSTEDHEVPTGDLVIRLLFNRWTYVERAWAIGDRHIFQEQPCQFDKAGIEVSGPARDLEAEYLWLERGGEWYEISCLDARDGFAMCPFVNDYGVRSLRECPHGDHCPEDDKGPLDTERQYVILAGSGEKVSNIPPIVYKPLMEFTPVPTED
ncbi:hypothetical protein PV11_10156 [Exophiala sideris]|uniref:Uncharacterized protein n=1 Tax=Exophiala sideris TaxID=1016849 RepID=A0A0D1WTG0_9EURO|nr:hypothetical protein PV11_10156 [Exophiala sideris]